MGTNNGPQNASEGPLALLQDASASRLLYSLMIIDALLTQDTADAVAVAAASGHQDQHQAGDWQDRFVRCGGLHTLLDLLLTRDWDADGEDRVDGAAAAAVQAGAEAIVRDGGDNRVGVSLACQSLLAELLGRFMDGAVLPTRWEGQQARLVSAASVSLVRACVISDMSSCALFGDRESSRWNRKTDQRVGWRKSLFGGGSSALTLSFVLF